MRKQLDLLAVEGNDADLAFCDPGADERLGKLADQRGFDFILDEVADARVTAGHAIGVDEDSFAADNRPSVVITPPGLGNTYDGEISCSSQQSPPEQENRRCASRKKEGLSNVRLFSATSREPQRSRSL